MSLLRSLKAWITGGHPNLAVTGCSRGEVRRIGDIARGIEGRLGVDLRSLFRLQVVKPQGLQPSKSLHIAVGVVWEKKLNLWVCGITNPGGRSGYVVRGVRDAIHAEIVAHEVAHAIAAQNKLEKAGVVHSPAGWRSKVWGWV
jgi:hypothetical protein